MTKTNQITKKKNELLTFLNKFDKNYLYLGLTIAIILLIMIIHTAKIENNSFSFGFCNYSISCSGISLGNVCLGGKVKSVSCINPENYTEEYRMVEMNCALEANAICKSPEVEDFEWINSSEYNGKNCQEWKAIYPKITLISCNQTFADITQYSLLR